MRCPIHGLVMQSAEVHVERVGIIPVSSCPSCGWQALDASNLRCFVCGIPGGHMHPGSERLVRRYEAALARHNQSFGKTE